MSDGPLLVIEEGGEVHRLYLDAAVFGRSKACDLSFDRAGVSRRHCELILRADGTLVRDLGSSHGTFLDGKRVHGEALVQRGQVVRLGPRGPRLRIVEARLGDVVFDADEPTRPVARAAATDDASANEIVAPTETAERPLAAAGGGGGGGPPKTMVSAVPRRPAPEQTPEPPSQMPGPARSASAAFARDLVLGVVLGIAAGLVLLVLVDLSPIRSALGS